MAAGTVAAVTEAARRGVSFNCLSREFALPLTHAIYKNDVDLVRALLDAKADPNARWSSHGDRFPLQDAVEAEVFGFRLTHRDELIRLLLDRGADPNQRWCEFESRGFLNSGNGELHCISEGGTTALLWAAHHGDASLVVQLLASGADPLIVDQFGAGALDYATTEGTFYPLLRATSPALAARPADVVGFLDVRTHTNANPGPWDETALTRAIAGQNGGGYGFNPLPPPLPAPIEVPGQPRPRVAMKPPYFYGSRAFNRSGIERVRILLDLGANPNRRLTWAGVDWTPLAVAIAIGEADTVADLVAHGADVDARWCVRVDLPSKQLFAPAPGCTLESGTLPLHAAAARGVTDIVRALLVTYPDPDLRDVDGHTALDIARANRHQEIVDYLEQYAAERRQHPEYFGR